LFVVEQDVSRLAMAGSSVVLSFAEHGVTLIKA